MASLPHRVNRSHRGVVAAHSRLALFGALLLIPTLIGAVVTHLFVVGGTPMPAIVLFVGSTAIAWVRRHQFTE